MAPDGELSALLPWLAAAGLVLLALAGYALLLWRRVWRLQRQRQLDEQARRERLRGDLRILAEALLSEQLPLIEGAIRIKVLLEHLDPALAGDSRTAVFRSLVEATAHIPTHADWKALERSERRRHEVRFGELELQHKAAARNAARWLLDEALRPLR